MVQFSMGRAIAIVPPILKQDHSKSVHFFRIANVFFEKMIAICRDFKYLGFHISDPIQNLDHLQTNPFLTIQNSS